METVQTVVYCVRHHAVLQTDSNSPPKYQYNPARCESSEDYNKYFWNSAKEL